MTLSFLDLLIVAAYLAAIVSIGVALKRKAARGLNAYFLGSRKLPWWALAMSGSSSYFDITGTMWIVSLLVILGFRAMWVQWIWGFVIAAFYMAYMGRWIRRSGVMTGSEWMLVRFGAGRGGDMARLAYTVYAVLTVVAFLAFASVGMGKFITAFVDVNPQVGAAVVILLTGVYVIAGGFQGMILVEVLQTTILSAGALMICWLGFQQFDAARFASILPKEWWSLGFSWELTDPGDAAYRFFGALVLVYVVKGLLLCLSGPEQLYDFQRFLAARDARDAQKLGALWGVIHTIRWPMAMAVAVLAIGAANAPAARAMIQSDPERALPVVLAGYLPIGVRGLAVAALLSGFLASFSSTVNAGASYLIKDIYKVYINPAAEGRRLLYASYIASALLIASGLIISVFAGSINLLFTWIMGTLGAGVLAPNVLRWYWWRMNGWGYAAGALTGMTLSLLQVGLERFAGLSFSLYASFPVILLLVAAATVTVSLLTPPVRMDDLVGFYNRTGSWGFWGPVARQARKSGRPRQDSTAARDLLAALIGMLLLLGLYLAPMYLIVHRYAQAALGGGVAAALAAVLYFTWYRRLPPPEEPSETENQEHTALRSIG